MKPTSSIRVDQYPTLNHVINSLLDAGADRGVLVRTAKPDRSAGVCVLMLSRKAMLAGWPLLKGHLAQLPKGDAKSSIFLDGHSSLALLFQEVAAGCQWATGALAYRERGGGQGLVIVITGPSVTETFAAELTARGFICNLNEH
jgi:hypothetical protein